MKNIKSIAVFCGSSFSPNKIYEAEIIKLSKLLVKEDITLIYGGGYRGYMGLIAQEVKENGGTVVGVLPEIFNNEKVKLKSVESKLIIAKDMHERKKMMYELADAFIILPGGIGTMDEFFEIFTWKQIGFHNKNIALFNISSFFDPLIAYLERCTKEGFLAHDVYKSLIISSSPEEMLTKLDMNKDILPSKI